MSSKIDFKSDTLINKHRKRTCRVGLSLSLALFLALSGNVYDKLNCLTFRNLFGTHRKHMTSKIDFKSRTLLSTHETHMSSKIASHSVRYSQKRTCRVRLPTTLVLYSARTKRTCQVRLTASIVHYSARTQNAHIK